MSPPITSKVRLDLMPNGNLAMEVGDLDAVVILTPKHARRLAARMRELLYGDSRAELIAERRRIDAALAHERRKTAARAG